MATFTFRIDRQDQRPVLKSRALADDAEAVAYARQLLGDWPDCDAIVVLQGEDLVDRLRPNQMRDQDGAKA